MTAATGGRGAPEVAERAFVPVVLALPVDRGADAIEIRYVEWVSPVAKGATVLYRPRVWRDGRIFRRGT
ncbi:hypothetical protein BCD48_35440 [Pseudofrankia sp. BMG5.36]|nr:hypothetical protein BCD48_35440 [Pseudofrankia sp. BMG5.36]